MDSIEFADWDIFEMSSTTNEPEDDLSSISTLGEIYFQIAILWFIIHVIGTRCRFLGESGDELSYKEYIHVVLSSIIYSKTYRYRSKCNYYCYKQYLRYQMAAIAKSQMSYILTMISLFELPDLDWSIVFAAIIFCVIAVVAIMIRIVSLSTYYPLSKSVHSAANQYTFDQRIIPYLVTEKTSGHWIPTYIDFPITCIGIYIIYIHNPSLSITIKLVISISLSLLFACKRMYDHITFYYKTYSVDQIMNDEQVLRAYNIYMEMKQFYLTHDVNNAADCNPFEIVANIVFVAMFLYFFLVSIMCSYEYYHDELSPPFCDPRGIQNWLWMTVICSTILSVFIAFLLCWIPMQSKKAKRILPVFWTLLTLLMIVFGSICVNKHGDNTNQFCGPAGYVGGVLLTAFGSSCCCCFWCLLLCAHKQDVAAVDNDNNAVLLTSDEKQAKTDDLEAAEVIRANVGNIQINPDQ